MNLVRDRPALILQLIIGRRGLPLLPVLPTEEGFGKPGFHVLCHFGQGLRFLFLFLFVFHSAPGWFDLFRRPHFGVNITEMVFEGNGPETEDRGQKTGSLSLHSM